MPLETVYAYLFVLQYLVTYLDSSNSSTLLYTIFNRFKGASILMYRYVLKKRIAGSDIAKQTYFLWSIWYFHYQFTLLMTFFGFLVTARHLKQKLERLWHCARSYFYCESHDSNRIVIVNSAIFKWSWCFWNYPLWVWKTWIIHSLNAWHE